MKVRSHNKSYPILEKVRNYNSTGLTSVPTGGGTELPKPPRNLHLPKIATGLITVLGIAAAAVFTGSAAGKFARNHFSVTQTLNEVSQTLPKTLNKLF